MFLAPTPTTSGPALPRLHNRCPLPESQKALVGGQREITLRDLNWGSPEAETEAGGDSLASDGLREGPQEKPVEKSGEAGQSWGRSQANKSFQERSRRSRPRRELWGIYYTAGFVPPWGREAGLYTPPC